MRVIKLWNRLLRDSPSMEIFMNSLQVGWTWWFLKDPFQLKVWFCDYGLACSGILHSVVRLGSCCWYHCLCQLCHHACLAASSSSWNSFLLLLPDMAGPESRTIHPYRMQLWQQFPPCEWVRLTDSTICILWGQLVDNATFKLEK